jgi:hypothetical protein
LGEGEDDDEEEEEELGRMQLMHLKQVPNMGLEHSEHDRREGGSLALMDLRSTYGSVVLRIEEEEELLLPPVLTTP